MISDSLFDAWNEIQEDYIEKGKVDLKDVRYMDLLILLNDMKKIQRKLDYSHLKERRRKEW